MTAGAVGWCLPGEMSDKCRAIFGGALAVFARDGYSRASIDAIAAEAGVSTRTIYNHFQGKERLFHTVIIGSTSSVADAQIAIIERHLRKVTDLEADLIELGQELAAPMTDYTCHFALIRQLGADLGHIPAETIETWRREGPARVTGELAGRLRELGEKGWLRMADPERAASHFMLLVSGAVPFQHGLDPTDEDEIPEIVTSGVRAFLHGYQV